MYIQVQFSVYCTTTIYLCSIIYSTYSVYYIIFVTKLLTHCSTTATATTTTSTSRECEEDESAVGTANIKEFFVGTLLL